MKLLSWFKKQFTCQTCGSWDITTFGVCMDADCASNAPATRRLSQHDPEIGRKRLPDRRMSIRDKVKYQNSTGSDLEAEVSFGLDRDGVIREVFCIAHKDGTDMQGIVHDACIAASIALQRGARVSDLAKSFGELRNEGEASGQPTSVIGAVARLGAALELEMAEGFT